MKWSAAFAVFLFVAATASSAGAVGPVVSTAVMLITETFTKLFRSQLMIKSVERQNYNVLTPTLNEISTVLQQGTDSPLFKFGTAIQNDLVDVNVKIGQIVGNSTVILTKIEGAAHSISKIKFVNKSRDYNFKKSVVKTLCEDTMAATNMVLRLIDGTKEFLGKNVSYPLRMLNVTLAASSTDFTIRQQKAIKDEQLYLDGHDNGWFRFWWGSSFVETSKAIIRQGEVTIHRVQSLLDRIVKHIDWLQAQCHDIGVELDRERNFLSVVSGAASNTENDYKSVQKLFNTKPDAQSKMTDDELAEGSEAMVNMLQALRDQVVNATQKELAERHRRSIPLHYMLN